MRISLAVLILTSCTPLIACADSEESNTTINEDQTATAPAAGAGPRPANPGEPSIGNETTLELKFRHLAKSSVGKFEGKCTAEEIIADSGWTGFEDDVATKGVDYFVACNKD